MSSYTPTPPDPHYTPTSPDPHYALGRVAMAAQYAVRNLPNEPKAAKQILAEALADTKPHMSSELRRCLEDAR